MTKLRDLLILFKKKKPTFIRTKIIVPLETKETCYRSLLGLLLLDTHPYRVNETEKPMKEASMKNMLETRKLSQAQLDSSEVRHSPPRPPALKSSHQDKYTTRTHNQLQYTTLISAI